MGSRPSIASSWVTRPNRMRSGTLTSKGMSWQQLAKQVLHRLGLNLVHLLMGSLTVGVSIVGEGKKGKRGGEGSF